LGSPPFILFPEEIERAAAARVSPSESPPLGYLLSLFPTQKELGVFVVKFFAVLFYHAVKNSLSSLLWSFTSHWPPLSLERAFSFSPSPSFD